MRSASSNSPGHSKKSLDPFAGTSARGITLCLDSEMNSRPKSHDFASSAHWVTGTGDDPKRTMSYRDRSLPSRTVGHRERSLLNPQIGQSGTQMPQIAQWVIGAVVCSTRELGTMGPIFAQLHFGASGARIAQPHSGSNGPIFARAGLRLGKAQRRSHPLNGDA
jgi:hypothetical protein